MKIVIIDDEIDAIQALSIMLTDFVEDVEIVGTACSAFEAIKLINTTTPDIVFLYVEMPYANGFDVLEAVNDRNFQLVFTTAYAHYAIQAIRANAFDYLMKPIDIDDLIRVVKSAKSQTALNQSSRNSRLLTELKDGQFTRIPVSVKGDYLFLELEDIQYIKSDGSYSIIHTFDKKYTTAKNLKHHEELLSENNFLRVSNSHLINVEKVVKYLREDGGMFELQNKSKIHVSRNRKKELKQSLRL